MDGVEEFSLHGFKGCLPFNSSGESVLDELEMYDLSASMLRALPGKQDSFQRHVFDAVVDLLRDAFAPEDVVFDEFRYMSHAFILRRADGGRAVACMILTPSTSADAVSGMSMDYLTMARDAPINARELLLDSAKTFLWIGVFCKHDLPLDRHCSDSADGLLYMVALNDPGDIDFAGFLDYMGFARTNRDWGQAPSTDEAWELALPLSA